MSAPDLSAAKLRQRFSHQGSRIKTCIAWKPDTSPDTKCTPAAKLSAVRREKVRIGFAPCFSGAELAYWFGSSETDQISEASRKRRFRFDSPFSNSCSATSSSELAAERDCQSTVFRTIGISIHRGRHFVPFSILSLAGQPPGASIRRRILSSRTIILPKILGRDLQTCNQSG